MKKHIIFFVSVCAFFTGRSQAPQQIDKVGYANIEYIISQLPDMKTIDAEMKSTQAQLRSQIQTKSQAVQKQYTDFSANANTLADTVRMRKQQELENAMGELERMQQDAQTALQNKQKLFMAPLYLKVNKAISDVARENGYSIILTDRIRNQDFLLYQTNQRDISNLVLQKFGVTPASK